MHVLPFTSFVGAEIIVDDGRIAVRPVERPTDERPQAPGDRRSVGHEATGHIPIDALAVLVTEGLDQSNVAILRTFRLQELDFELTFEGAVLERARRCRLRARNESTHRIRQHVAAADAQHADHGDNIHDGSHRPAPPSCSVAASQPLPDARRTLGTACCLVNYASEVVPNLPRHLWPGAGQSHGGA